MNSRRLKQGVVLAALSIALGAAEWMIWPAASTDSMGAKVPVHSLPSPSTAATSPQPQLQDVASAAMLAAKPARQVSAQLQQDWLRAADMRKFALDALRRPAEGGLYYAEQAAYSCAEPDTDGLDAANWVNKAIEFALITTRTISNAQIKAIERINTRCAAFASGEALQVLAQARALGSQRTDPLMAAVTDLRAAVASKDPAQLQRAVNDFIALHDPLMLSQDAAVVRLLQYLQPGNSPDEKAKLAFVLDGETFTPEDLSNFQSFNVALQLAVCPDNAPCATDHIMLTACAAAGVCAESRRDFMGHPMLSGEINQRRVAELAEKLRPILQSDNWKQLIAAPERKQP